MVRDVVLMDLLFGKPLVGVTGPVERVEEKGVVVVRRLFFPNFVLLVDYHLFLLIEFFRHFEL